MGLLWLWSSNNFGLDVFEGLDFAFLDVLLVDAGLVAVLAEGRGEFIFEEAVVLLFELFIDSILDCAFV